MSADANDQREALFLLLSDALVMRIALVRLRITH